MAAVLASGLAAFAVTACVGTTRIDDALLAGKQLETSGKGIMLVQIGQSGAACHSVALHLAKREGDAFQFFTFVRAIPDRSRNAPPPAKAQQRQVGIDGSIAEQALDPGEYHVVQYTCAVHNGQRVLAEKDASRNRYVQSYASFSIKAGEVLNVGYFDIAEVPALQGFGNRVVTVRITDWPLADMELFKKQRPKLFQRMTTRLMTATPLPAFRPQAAAPPTAEECSTLAALKAQGKIQALPPTCPGGASTRAAAGNR
ncbi:MAG: hypothetical protein RL291_1964 [Pseudomonadota bacterium]